MDLRALSETPLASDTLGLLAGLCSTRSIRRYHDESVPDVALRDILFAATRAPSGSNRQPFRFVTLTGGPIAAQAKRLIGDEARRVWADKRVADGFDAGSGADENSPKSRSARVMQDYVETFHKVPVLVLPCLVRYRAATSFEGASVYPACQNLLLAARALGYGGVLTGWHFGVVQQLHELLGIPHDVHIAATITLGRPVGAHGPVRRRPMAELVSGESWGVSPSWAIDPPETAFTSAGPPLQTAPKRMVPGGG